MSVVTIEDETWATIASEIVFVPVEFAQPSLNTQQAMEMLRCSRQALSGMVSAGLPAVELGGDWQFDANDIYNLGTYSGTGTTQPELAFKMLFRFMSAEISTLTSARAWSFRLHAECRDCADTATWAVAEPTTSRFGGSITETALVPQSGTVTYSAVVHNGGVRTPVVAQRIRSCTKDLIESGLRWQMLPSAMQGEFENVHARGVTNCISMSLALAQQLTSAGYEATARRGWFCGALGGILDLPHAWVEVVDDDGELKAIDPASSLLATKVPSSEEFQELCLGTPFNRVIPASVLADAPLARHLCGAPDDSVDVRTEIRSQKSGLKGKRNA